MIFNFLNVCGLHLILLFIPIACLFASETEKEIRLVNILDINPNIQLDIRYATSNNFLGFPVYSKAACYLHKDVAEALSQVQDELEEMGLSLKVFDGYRPLYVQQIMWDTIQDERYVSNPAVNKGRHTRGTAIDLTIVDDAGKELEMPTEFDDFTEKAHSNFAGASEEALKNRKLLKSVMEKHGFEQFPFEWWHFDISGWKDDVKYPSLNLTFDEIDK